MNPTPSVADRPPRAPSPEGAWSSAGGAESLAPWDETLHDYMTFGRIDLQYVGWIQNAQGAWGIVFARVVTDKAGKVTNRIALRPVAWSPPMSMLQTVGGADV